MTAAAISVQGVSKRFGSTLALDDVAFDVPAGAIFGLLGPNGAGKTTLFSILAGFLGADAGRLRVLDVDIERVAQLQGRMTILPQDASFQRNVPILEQLVFFRRLDGSDARTAEREVIEALDKVGLADYRKRGVHALSHGMLKRLGVAQAFLGSPEVIILDEPTSGLDPQNARQIRDLVSDLQRSRGVTTVVSSHNLAEIQELCDHVAILDRGRLRACGAVAEITRQDHVLDVTTSQPLAAADREALAALACSPAVEDRGERRYRLRYAIPGEQTADDVLVTIVRLLLDRGIAPRALSEGNTLEEFFLSVTGDDDAGG